MGAAAERVARRLAAATAAGGLLGLLVGGVGGRLAMTLIAGLNPGATGVTSDDGFRIGQFTLAGTVNLLLVTSVIGALGGGIYLVLRDVMIGPTWFRMLSVAVGPAVVVGSVIVHTDGVDFTVLRPPLLSIALFVAIPAVHAALLAPLAERWLHPDGRFATAPRPLALTPLVLWLPIAPLLAAGAAGWLLAEWIRRHRPPTPRTAAAIRWAVRATLAILFAACLTTLLQETIRLT